MHTHYLGSVRNALFSLWKWQQVGWAEKIGEVFWVGGELTAAFSNCKSGSGWCTQLDTHKAGHCIGRAKMPYFMQ